MVYYIQARHGGCIKIGYAEFPKQRLKTLQAGCPVELVLLAEHEGNHLTETKVHDRFFKTRHHREWFECTSELVDFISKNTTAYHRPCLDKDIILKGERTYKKYS